MEVNKSLYMSDFLKMRQEIGCIEHYSVKNILYMNLYDEMTPKQHSTEIIQSIKDIQDDIQDKTIMIIENRPELQEQSSLPELFSDLPDPEEDIPQVKKIQIKEIEPEKKVESLLKHIKLDPGYVAKNE